MSQQCLFSSRPKLDAVTDSTPPEMTKISANLHAVKLTKEEEDLFEVLTSCAEQIQSENPNSPPLTLRVAGGWVRDKLLGKNSDDIDIAIDTMKGEPFAMKVNSFMENRGLHMGHIATIQVNPEKSKHLETANAKVFGHLVDFVHLRTETYSDDSRNPSVDYGTPLEDALRRDITINAMFYNIHTREVEDFTGKGLTDLSKGHIRTPLPARQTFIDDPLRILRVIRFATRFGYDIDEDILSSIRDEEIKVAFEKKITRERVGVELHKMLKGKDPLRSLRLIHEFGFYSLVFAVPAGHEIDVDDEIMIRAARVVPRLLDSTAFKRFWDGACKTAFCEEDRELLFLTAAVVPFRDLTYVEKSKRHFVSKDVVLHSLKLSMHDADVSSAVLANIENVQRHVNKHAKTPGGLDRKTLGIFVRELGGKPLRDKWPLAVLFAWIMEVVECTAQETASTASFDDSPVSEISTKYITFIKAIRSLGLEDAQDFRASLNGKEIATLLGIKPGPQIGVVLEKLIHWQFENPNARTEECRAWVSDYAKEHLSPSVPPIKKRRSE